MRVTRVEVLEDGRAYVYTADADGINRVDAELVIIDKGPSYVQQAVDFIKTNPAKLAALVAYLAGSASPKLVELVTALI